MWRNAVTAVLCGASVVLATASPAEAATWRDVPSAALTYNGGLDRVDFADSGAGWAVGSQGSIFGPQAMIVRWNGSSWAGQTSPVGFFPTDVAAASATRAWAIGYNLTSGTVGIHWNGTAWTKVDYPMVGMPFMVSAAPDGTAYSLAGIDASGGGLSAILRWNGTAWVGESVPLPPSTTVTAVEVKSKDDVWLAGTTTDGVTVTALVMRWNGTSWSRIDVPGSMGTPAYRAAVHRIVVHSPTNVYLDRVAQNAQVTNALLRWNGSSWTTITTPLNAAGVGMSSDGGSGVVVLPPGTGNQTRYLHYDGSAWTTLTGPARSGTVAANDVDHRPGTTGIGSVGTDSQLTRKVPFIEYFG
ncbi:hypothetical protein [Spirillospora sp. NPDC047279]|uniref:hypothetical protein n=1 Tax=Spirillospora sp. NPDC047279 TaxID=3155478 RepID=UPI0033F099D0